MFLRLRIFGLYTWTWERNLSNFLKHVFIKCPYACTVFFFENIGSFEVTIRKTAFEFPAKYPMSS